MKKILVLSVGGSAEPIVNAIKNILPDFVYFFCSSDSKKTIDSPGYPCYPKGKAIVFQAGLGRENYEIVTVENPDDLDAYHQEIVGKAYFSNISALLSKLDRAQHSDLILTIFLEVSI